MQDEKKAILGRLYFVRATLSKISQNKDKAEEAGAQTEKEIFIKSQEELERRKHLAQEKERVAEEQKKTEESIEATENKLKKNQEAREGYLSNMGALVFTILFVLATALINFFLFRWWVNRDYSFWIGLLAFPIGILSLICDITLTVQCNPSVYEKQRKEDMKKSLAEQEILQAEEEKTRTERDLLSQEQAIISKDIEILEKETLEFKAKKEKELSDIQKTLSGETDQLYNAAKSETLIDERDWKHLDVIIYVLETGRAETMKEALQQADLFVRHEEIKDAIRTSALAICQTIRQSIDDLSYSIGLRLSELQTEMERIGDAQEGISARFDSMIDAQKLNNALLEKANVSSEQLAADVHRMRHISDEAYYRV